MPFSIDDLLERLGFAGKKTIREVFREEAASLGQMTKEDISKLFPNVELSDSKEVIYAPFKLCHSLPKVNLRGRCFTAKVLSNSFASVRDGLINVDHQMSRRQGGAVEDTISGHIVCGRFDPYGVYKDEVASEKIVIPEQPIPIMGLAALYLRSKYVPDILREHLNGERNWQTSMECAHNADEAAFWYRGEMIPAKDAEPGMRECVEKFRVKDYKGHRLAFALGGIDGKVDFHAAALTPDAADKGADLLAFVTKADYSEAANSGRANNPFFFPLETVTFDKPAEQDNGKEEAVSTDELANISVLGKTAPAEDGHQHDVLSDGTIVPIGGHTHCVSSWGIARGTTPRFTGRTDTHYEYNRVMDGSGYSREHAQVHMHMIDIPLRGKASKTEGEAVTDDLSNAGLYQGPLLPTVSFTEFDGMDEILKNINRVLAMGKFEGAAAQEVASLRDSLSKVSQTELIKQAVKQELANLTAAGEVVPKAEHDAAVAAAAKAEADKAEAAAKEAAARTKRREQIIGLGLTMEDKFDDKIDVTVGQYIDAIGLDENGEKSFKVAFSMLENIVKTQADQAAAELAKKATEAPAATPVTATQDAAANAGGDGAKPRRMLLVGGGTGAAAEEEAAAGAATPAKPAKKVGRHLFSALAK